MRNLWDLTRGLAKIVDVLVNRVAKLETDALSQERRLDSMEENSESSFHSMEVKQQEMVDREQTRQDELSEGDLRQELKEEYGSTNWARRLINELVGARNKRKHDSSH